MQSIRLLGIVVKSIRLCLYKNHYTIIEYSTVSNQSSISYCVDTVRQFDYENFMCTLLLPSNYRTSAFAIRAFNIEVARVQDHVSDSRIGQMRMKFWEDTVEKIYVDDIPRHPVAMELYHASKRHKLTKRFLKRLITVRSAQLTCPTFPDLEAIELYCEASVSSVYYLLLESAGLQNVNADHAASHLGKAHGIVNLIRAVPHNASHRIVTLPQDVLARHGVSHEALFRAQVSKQLQDAVLEVANRANQHLHKLQPYNSVNDWGSESSRHAGCLLPRHRGCQPSWRNIRKVSWDPSKTSLAYSLQRIASHILTKARSLGRQVPKEAFPVLLPAVAVSSYLDRLQAADFDVFHPQLRHRTSLLPLKLFWNKFVSKF